MKSLRLEVPDELYDRYFGPSIKPTSVNKDDLKVLGDAFLNGESLIKICPLVKPDSPLKKVVSDVDKKAYVVTANGWRGCAGAEIYLIGVFFDEETAKRTAAENEGIITEVDIDKAYPLIRSVGEWENKENDLYLGGYYE